VKSLSKIPTNSYAFALNLTKLASGSAILSSFRFWGSHYA